MAGRLGSAWLVYSLLSVERRSIGVLQRRARVANECARVANESVVMADPASITAHVRALARPQTAAPAAEALRALSNEVVNRDAFAEAGAIPQLIALLRDGCDSAKTGAASTLWNIATTDGYKVVIAEAGAIPPLISLVRAGSAIAQAQAAMALRTLSLNEDNRLAVAAGAIPPLVALVKNGNDVGKRQAAAALWNLSLSNAAKVTIHEEGGLAVLLAVLRDGSKNAKHEALGALPHYGNFVEVRTKTLVLLHRICLLYTSPSPRDRG